MAMGYVADEMRKLLDKKDPYDRAQLLGSKKYRSWLQELGILDEYYRAIPHTWVTIRLPKDKEPEYYKDALCDKLASVEWCQGGKAVFEEGGRPNPHIHLLLTEKRHRSNTVKRFAKLFGIPPQFVDHEVSDCLKHHANREGYLRGDKVAAEKQEAVQRDRVYRETHGIPHLVSF